MLAKILRNGIWILGLRIVNVLCAFGVAAILGRALLPEELGSYFLAMSAAMLVAIASQLGMGTVAVKEIAAALATSNQIAARHAAQNALTVGLYGAVVVLALAVLVAFTMITLNPAGELWSVTIITGILGVGLGLQTIVSEVLRGYHRIAISGLFNGALFNFVFRATLVPVTVFFGRIGLTETLTLSLLALCVSLILGLWALRQIADLSLGSTPLKENIVNGFPFWVNSLVSLIYTHADLWIAGMVLSLQETALYGAATRIALLLTLPIEALETGLAPLLASSYASGNKMHLRNVIHRTTQIQTLLVGAGALLIWLAGGKILSLAFGPHYSSAHQVLSLLAFGLAIRAALGPCGYALSMTGRAYTLLVCNMLIGVLFLPAGWAGANLGGTTGLASVSALALVAGSLCTAWLAWQHLGINVTYFSLSLHRTSKKR